MERRGEGRWLECSPPFKDKVKLYRQRFRYLLVREGMNCGSALLITSMSPFQVFVTLFQFLKQTRIPFLVLEFGRS